MAETTNEQQASEGPMGQTYLAAGKSVAMRLWEEAPGEAQDKDEHSQPYETVGYVIEGRAELTLDGETITLQAGDSWTVPANAKHTYTIEQDFKAVEATSPPARSQS